jgi:ABC-type transport system involved in cytochrome c biogenesis permease subunit
VIFILGCFAWVGWTLPLVRTALGLALLTFAVHTIALIARMVIMGRPPVTNLYSSAIFIGWVAVGTCLVLEFLFRNGISVVVAGACGFATMIIAHLLATGDTMEVLQAVLDTNFWLATHVVCVTMGYAATYLAGLFAMGYILCRWLGRSVPSLDASLFKTLAQIVYGVVCFAMLLSFTGTVLGGIWADQSWGRFWGWDPKENGALLIVIWNALILHARWSGLVKERGMCVLAVAGNIITTWSWFGTNMLGVGLHSYGFMAGALWGMLAAVVFFLAWIKAGILLPKR